jgi:hypothetical protein
LTVFLVGVAPVLAAFGAWQWLVFGSPFSTGYQAAGATINGSSDLGTFFNWSYVVGPSFGSMPRELGGPPNAAFYVLALAGADGLLSLPGLAVVGLAACLMWSRRRDPLGLYARLALTALIGGLAIYLPYFWQTSRFLLAQAALLNVAGVVALVHAAATLLKER